MFFLSEKNPIFDKNVFRSLFSDIEILLDKEVAGGVYLTIRVKEYPRLEKIELIGNKKLKKDDIDKELDFYRGQVLSDFQINKAVRSLKKMYREKGYLLAQITPETYNSEKEGRVILRLKIKEGGKVQIKKINFFILYVFPPLRQDSSRPPLPSPSLPALPLQGKISSHFSLSGYQTGPPSPGENV